MTNKRDPVKIDVMSGDRCIKTVYSKYWRRDASGKPLQNARSISIGPFSESVTITHFVVDGVRFDV